MSDRDSNNPEAQAVTVEWPSNVPTFIRMAAYKAQSVMKQRLSAAESEEETRRLDDAAQGVDFLLKLIYDEANFFKSEVEKMSQPEPETPSEAG